MNSNPNADSSDQQDEILGDQLSELFDRLVLDDGALAGADEQTDDCLPALAAIARLTRLLRVPGESTGELAGAAVEP
ncbi:MAG: hypothetical protein MI861_00120, partial [Pirellulales bacterium]|nr:hypothetical protein [Pirellulales bacterium]